MANPEHIKKLKEGVEAWNLWRKENPGIQPELSGEGLRQVFLFGANFEDADLYGANFVEANLNRANLARAYLRKAQLTKADLREANLRNADLSNATLTFASLQKADFSEANLSGTYLLGTDFTDAKLRGTHLKGADLSRANFSNAIFSEADFTEAITQGTIFLHIDLSDVKGLETIQHRGPSSIDLDTIERSKGSLPSVFLQGVGASDTSINFFTALTRYPIKYYSCFISYSSQDQEFVQQLHDGLQEEGVRCWLDSEDMKIGDKIRPTIDRAIRVHDKLLLILSKRSVASHWVEHEVEHALDLENERGSPVLFPIRLDDAVMNSKLGWAATIRRECHIGDFSRWKDHDAYQTAFERLLRDLKAKG